MDLQTMLNNAMTARRAEIMKTSPQLTLGELILKMEVIENKNLPVVFDIEKYHPISIDSWRGSYEELAFEYSDGENILIVRQLLKLLKGTVGRTLTGYKGGEYLMGKITPVWVANWSECIGFRQDPKDYKDLTYTAVVDVLEEEDKIIIKTEALEY